MSTVEVKVPNIGDFKEVEVIELMVKVGDTIKVDQSLITVESDKASMEIPSTHAGVVKEVKVKVGDKIAEGSALLVVEALKARRLLRQRLRLLHRLPLLRLRPQRLRQPLPPSRPAATRARSTSPST